MSHPNLVFNRCWYGKIMKRSKTEDELFHVINKLQHIGNIDNFTLHIPVRESISGCYFCQGMVLSLTNSNKNPYLLPYCILCCPTLTGLAASNCIFEPPKSHEGFHKLTRLIFLNWAKFCKFCPQNSTALLFRNKIMQWHSPSQRPHTECGTLSGH